MTLNDVSRETTVFADRPSRVAGTMPTEELVSIWDVGGGSFAEDPPNAELSCGVSGVQQDAVVVELSEPDYTAWLAD